jgi:hypothetical protein
MKLHKDAITWYAKKGIVTMEVPHDLEPADTEFPDKWFKWLAPPSKIITCNPDEVESKYLYLTRIGYVANYDDIKQAYKDKWEEFVQCASAHFDRVDQNKDELIKDLEDTLQYLRDYNV